MYSAPPRLVAAVQALALAVLLSAGIALGQSSQAGSERFESADPFSGWHAALSTAADKALAAELADRPWMKIPAVSAPDSIAQTPVDRLEHFRAGVERVQQLRPTIEPILRQEGIPAELSAVVLVESGGQSAAISPKGARGIWQFMPDTARRYGLVISKARDDRTDVEKSTRAAARYLRDLYGRFGNWSLALAAYNAGELLIQGAVDRTGSSDFTAISNTGRIPAETRSYVPAVVAAVKRLQDHGLFGPNQTESKPAHVIYAIGPGN